MEAQQSFSQNPARLLVSIAFALPAQLLYAADEDIYFVEKVCLSVMKDNPNIPKKNSSRLCHCSANKISKAITEHQRLSLRVMRHEGEKNRVPERNLFAESGLSSLVKSSQSYCANELWPSTHFLTQEQQAAYTAQASKSVKEFKTMIRDYCRATPNNSAERNACLAYAAKEWLSSKGGEYSDIDDRFMSANDLAWSYIDH